MLREIDFGVVSSMEASEILFSLIVPTRGRPDQLRGFLDSVRTTIDLIGQTEVVLVMDSDDESMKGFEYEGLRTTQVVVSPGLNMGALNMAGYEKARGQYLMLTNDDVVIKTQGWDRKTLDIFKSFSDGIVLVHTNDTLFEDKLCTFPFLTREFCELAGGICPPDYIRYRIDDHIYNVFNLLAILGHKRIAYLPDVVFEHHNFVVGESGKVEYVPIPEIHEKDSIAFDNMLEDRKDLAVKIAARIDDHRNQKMASVREKLLRPITDSVSLRRPEYVRRLPAGRLTLSEARVTIGVVSADLRGDHARTCIDLLKKHTTNFELVLIDNNFHSDFNHSREMNRILKMCRTDFLVLMDDDVWVTPGWLEGLLDAVEPDVGVVTPLHTAKNGDLSYGGIVMKPDNSGHHTHIYEAPSAVRPVQTLCSAVMLIDMAKCGHLRVGENFSKYFLDIDYGLSVWEAGFQVKVTPHSVCCHLGGATLAHNSDVSNALYEAQRQSWVRDWIDTGRYQNLVDGIWTKHDEIYAEASFPVQLEEYLIAREGETAEQYLARAMPMMKKIQKTPSLIHYVRDRVAVACEGNFVGVYDESYGHLMLLYGLSGIPTLINANWNGYDLYVCGDRYYALVHGHGYLTIEGLKAGEYQGILDAATIEGLRDRINLIGVEDPIKVKGPANTSIREIRANYKGFAVYGGDSFIAIPIQHAPYDQAVADGDGYPVLFSATSEEGILAQIDHANPELVVEGYRGFNIIRYGKYFAIPQAEGSFEINRVLANDYQNLLKDNTISQLQALIDRFWMRRLPGRTLRFAGRQMKKMLPKSSRRTQQNMVGRGLVDARDNENADRRKIASTVKLVSEQYKGYAIFRYEHKFFGVPVDALHLTSGEYDHDYYLSPGYEGQVVGHTLLETHTLIDRVGQKDARSQGKNVVLACVERDALLAILEQSKVKPDDVVLLVGQGQKDEWPEFITYEVSQPTILQWARETGGEPPSELKQETITRVMIPWLFPDSWVDNSIEAAASGLAEHVEVLTQEGGSRLYFGENLHRVIYNKAYLSSMFQYVPPPNGQDLLEIGCSDGLVCDLMKLCGSNRMVGIDVMNTAGCSFRTEGVEYYAMDAAAMDFADESFDTVFSIATMEHVPDPVKVLEETCRVLKKGGYAYVQAGPLYHSPFGHHMFSYFKDFPWVHLRKSREEIISYAKKMGMNEAIEKEMAMSAEAYINGMLNRDHVNGLLLADYGLEAFKARPDVEVLMFNVSYEGKDLLNTKILKEVAPLTEADLTEHGFELVFRKKG